MAHADSSLLQQLGVNSTPYHDPLAHLPWDQLSVDDYWLPESALSLAGLAEFDAMPEPTKRRLSQYEFLGFIQAGVWLEGIFMERLGKTLKRSVSLPEYAYHLHEIREEAGHSLMFLELVQRSGLAAPHALRHRPRLADFLGRHSPANSTLFWLAVVVGEEIPDRLNRHVRLSGDKVNPLIRQMCTLHIVDEARHIARARNALEASLERQSGFVVGVLNPVVNRLVRQFVSTFYLPSADVYESAGLLPGPKWRALAQSNPQRHRFIEQCVAPTLNLLGRYGFRVPTPKP